VFQWTPSDKKEPQKCDEDEQAYCQQESSSPRQCCLSLFGKSPPSWCFPIMTSRRCYSHNPDTRMVAEFWEKLITDQSPDYGTVSVWFYIVYKVITTGLRTTVCKLPPHRNINSIWLRLQIWLISAIKHVNFIGTVLLLKYEWHYIHNLTAPQFSRHGRRLRQYSVMSVVTRLYTSCWSQLCVLTSSTRPPLSLCVLVAGAVLVI